MGNNVDEYLSDEERGISWGDCYVCELLGCEYKRAFSFFFFFFFLSLPLPWMSIFLLFCERSRQCPRDRAAGHLFPKEGFSSAEETRFYWDSYNRGGER